MRVLFIHERFSPDVGGGGEYVALERARGMIARGHSVRVICAGDPAVRDYQGVPTRRFRIPRKLVALLLPLAVIEARRADIVHGFSFHAAPLAWLAARLARRPVVCEQLGLFGPVWREMRPGLGGRVHQLLERLQLWLPFDGHVFLSDGSLQLARRAGLPQTPPSTGGPSRSASTDQPNPVSQVGTASAAPSPTTVAAPITRNSTSAPAAAAARWSCRCCPERHPIPCRSANDDRSFHRLRHTDGARVRGPRPERRAPSSTSAAISRRLPPSRSSRVAIPRRSSPRHDRRPAPLGCPATFDRRPRSPPQPTPRDTPPIARDHRGFVQSGFYEPPPTVALAANVAPRLTEPSRFHFAIPPKLIPL
ncbi:MAG: glycosyltransferase [Amaricoccus sp.]